MIIEHRTRYKHQNGDGLSKKTELYEGQERRKADRPDKEDRFSFNDKDTYDKLSLTRWLDNSGRPIKRSSRINSGTSNDKTPRQGKEHAYSRADSELKSELAKDTLKTKRYDVESVGAGTVAVKPALLKLMDN